LIGYSERNCDPGPTSTKRGLETREFHLSIQKDAAKTAITRGLGVVASDLEGTLTVGNTWQGLAAYLRQDSLHMRAFKRFERANTFGSLRAKLGLTQASTYQQAMVQNLPSLFVGMTPEEFAEIAEWVVQFELWPKRRASVINELESHLRVGRRVILAASTYQPVLEAFASRLGVGAIGTPLEVKNGLLTGQVEIAVNSGEMKAARLRNAIGSASIDFAYGDTLSDQEMLEMAHNPIIIRGDRRLEALANQRNWRVLESSKYE
jgi:phosphoserine phosphatase